MPHHDLVARHWFVVVNPTAGSGLAGRRWPLLVEQLAQLLPSHEVAFSTHAGHTTQLVEAAIGRGVRHLLAVGGDGTLHELINGILRQTEVSSADLVFALLPVGTGNDWIRTHGIPQELTDWMQMFKTGQVQWQNAGLLRYHTAAGPQTRYFANVAGLAYDGFVVRFTSRWRAPRWSSRLYYLASIVLCLFSYRPQRARLHFDGQTVEQAFYTINAGVCRYSGGGMRVVPQAEPQAPHLALTFAGPVSRWGVVRNLYRFYDGSIGQHPLITTTFARHLRVEAKGDGPILLEADGEFLGESPIEIEWIPEALFFVAPGPFATKNSDLPHS